ncbi:LysE family translocator [Acinetobacter baumannii]|uniref:LysE family translocator n=1 Tax=Acinetobacter baumannii TaxID=470 RepID=UPI000D0B775E|nr:LysE family translocator [Acinetobacter baumannii]EHU1557914.1 LysE family translocator [Acinetobacter baumannii]MBR8609325.1 LysE family translocator [Acinetobacter baumannii]MDC5587036.1 LysE family translocator [Acinetobacter baumannii]MDH2467330.1 LysE family translocator [Acinetobacter baumannii]MDH2478437.1 LysE family translocator [Acinetobacter baumannii]
MVSIELLITFVITTLIFAYMPGPAMLYTAAQTLSKGKRAGLMASLGIFIGGCFHIVAASIGLTAIFKTTPMLYDIIKLLGAGYLIWLGIKLIRSKLQGNLEIDLHAPEVSFRQSILVEVFNPKTAIFYISFLPQFINTTSDFSVWLQFIILGLFVNLAFVSADIVCVFLADYILKRFKKSQRTQKVMSLMGGSIFIGLGLFLAFNSN